MGWHSNETPIGESLPGFLSLILNISVSLFTVSLRRGTAPGCCESAYAQRNLKSFCSKLLINTIVRLYTTFKQNCPCDYCIVCQCVRLLYIVLQLWLKLAHKTNQTSQLSQNLNFFLTSNCTTYTSFMWEYSNSLSSICWGQNAFFRTLKSWCNDLYCTYWCVYNPPVPLKPQFKQCWCLGDDGKGLQDMMGFASLGMIWML